MKKKKEDEQETKVDDEDIWEDSGLSPLNK